MGWLVTSGRFLKPSTIRFVFLWLGAVAFFITEFGRRVYRPFVREHGIDDFGLADSIGNLGGIVVQIFLTLALVNATRKQSYLIATFLSAGYVVYEFVQPVLPRGVFDLKDIYGTGIGYCFSLLILVILWRLLKDMDDKPDFMIKSIAAASQSAAAKIIPPSFNLSIISGEGENNIKTVRKLKPDWSMTGLIPAFATIAIWSAAFVLFGINTALYAGAFCFLLYALFSLYASIRTGNAGYAIAGLYQIFIGMAFIFAAMDDRKFANLLFVFAIFSGLWMIYLLIQKKLKWRGREILELAAVPVADSKNGFTSRPLPSVKTEYSKNTILDFAQFASKNLIALTYVENDRVVFFPVMMGEEYGHLLAFHPDYENSTWISFDYEGKVSVNISQKDYLKYKENLTFNQLCESLGHLFAEFLDLFSKGEGIRIIDRMDNLRMSVFS